MTSHAGVDPHDGVLRTIAEGVHAYLGVDGMPNAVWVNGRDAVVVIDTLFTPRHAQQMLGAIRRLTAAPIAAIVNTHFHGDHLLGNTVFDDVDRIIAHEFTVRHLTTSGAEYMELLRRHRPDLAPEWGDNAVRVPTETLCDELTIDVGGLRVELLHHGRTAHTRGDLVVRIPDRRVLVASDLVFNGIVPVMRDGDLEGLKTTLEDLAADKSLDVIVPGHGDVGGRELIDQQHDFTVQLLDICRASIGSDRPEHVAHDRALEAFGHLMFAEERLSTGIEKTLHQLRGVP